MSVLEMTNELQFSVKSMMDDFGRVFIKDGRIFRAIHESKKNYCLDLLASQLFKELLQKKLIPNTFIVDFTVPGYALVLEHEKLTESLQHEWSFGMLKDAALTVLEVNEICEKYGYELKDAHTLNVLFQGSNPMMVDIGSIAIKENTTRWQGYEEFLSSFMVPLLCWSRNEIYVTRKLLESNFHRMTTIPAQQILETGIVKILPELSGKYYFNFRGRKVLTTSSYNRICAFVAAKTNRVIKFLSRKDVPVFSYEMIDSLSQLFPYSTIRQIVSSLQPPTVKSMWQGYHTKFYSANGEVNYSPRFLRILAIIKSIEPELNSVIDLAGNEGYLCFLLKKNTSIKKITLVDYDENAVDVAYQTAKQNGFIEVNTVLMNMMFTPDITGTAKRLKSDLAIALAVTHHLILTTQYSLSAIFERLKIFSNKYVMIEFMPLGLWALGEKTFPAIPEWYTEAWFKNEFEKYFNLILHEKLEDNRIIFFGEIISK